MFRMFYWIPSMSGTKQWHLKYRIEEIQSHFRIHAKGAFLLEYH